jgi:hypothetical protein
VRGVLPFSPHSHRFPSTTRRRLFAAFVFLTALAVTLQAQTLDAVKLREVRQYIKRSWTTLRRDNATLLKSATGTKVGQAGRLILYISRKENQGRITSQLRRQLSPAQFRRMDGTVTSRCSDWRVTASCRDASLHQRGCRVKRDRQK